MTFPTKFSERMRAAMFPQQNLKRREAAFCWARRRFAPAKCRNIPSIRRSPPAVSLRERSDEGGTCTHPIRTCAYDPSQERRDGTAGLFHRIRTPQPSTQPVLVREPTSAFSVRWGGSYCPLCSTPRNRGAAPRGKHHHTFLRIKV